MQLLRTAAVRALGPACRFFLVALSKVCIMVQRGRKDNRHSALHARHIRVHFLAAPQLPNNHL